MTETRKKTVKNDNKNDRNEEKFRENRQQK